MPSNQGLLYITAPGPTRAEKRLAFFMDHSVLLYKLWYSQLGQFDIFLTSHTTADTNQRNDDNKYTTQKLQ